MAVVNVTADASTDDLDALTRSLESAGMQIERVRKLTGVISGTASSNTLSKLRRIPGVTAVEVDQELHAI